MKSLCFLITLLFCIQFGFTQTTITNAIIPSVGYMFNKIDDNSPIGVSRPAMGPNMNWDFTNFIPTDNNTYIFVDPSMTDKGDSFPNADIALVNIEDSIITYFDSTFAGLKIIGEYIYLEAIDTVAVFQPNEMILPTPFNYLDSLYDYSKYLVVPCLFPINHHYTYPFRIFTQKWKNMVAKGWGTVATPAGFYQNVVCIESRVLRRDTMYVDVGFGFIPWNITSDTYILYDFYDTNVGPVMSFEVDSISGTVRRYSYIYKTWATGIEENSVSSDNEILVSPNPASESAMLTLRTPAKKGDMVRVTDLSGRIVKEFGLEGSGNYSNISFSVADLTNGTYLVSVSGSVMLQSKLVVNK